MEPRPGGRPSRHASADSADSADSATIRALQERVAELEQALHEAQVREEIALVLPRLHRTAGDDPAPAADVGEKKTRRRPVKIPKPR